MSTCTVVGVLETVAQTAMTIVESSPVPYRATCTAITTLKTRA